MRFLRFGLFLVLPGLVLGGCARTPRVRSKTWEAVLDRDWHAARRLRAEGMAAEWLRVE